MKIINRYKTENENKQSYLYQNSQPPQTVGRAPTNKTKQELPKMNTNNKYKMKIKQYNLYQNSQPLHAVGRTRCLQRA
jgi:hypothetical protein